MRRIYSCALLSGRAVVSRDRFRDAVSVKPEKVDRWPRGYVSEHAAQLAVSACLCLTLCSCLNPYIKPTAITYCDQGAHKTNPPKPSCQDLTDTSKAVDIINTSVDQVDTKLSANVYAGGVLDYATFGLAAAFGVKAAHGTKLGTGARNLATGAGIAYTGRSLFASNDLNALYLNAESNLMCVANRGNDLMAAYDQASGVKAAYDPGSNTTDKTKLDIIQVLSGCDPSKDHHLDQGVIDAMLASNATMGRAITTVRSLDGTIAVQLNSASTNIITTLNLQLSAKEPNPQAILHAGAEANAIATNIVEGGVNPVPKGRDRTQCQATNKEVGDFKTQLDGAIRAIVAGLNAIGDLKGGCAAVANVPVSPLSVSPASLTMRQGSNSTLVILGGRSPFTVSWDKASQPANIDDVPFQAIAGTNLITISAAAKAKVTTGPYKLRVSDSAAVTSTVDVSIEVVSQKQ